MIFILKMHQHADNSFLLHVRRERIKPLTFIVRRQIECAGIAQKTVARM